MKRILFVLLLATATAHAQEVRGPFDIGVSPYGDVHFAAVGSDTIEFVRTYWNQSFSHWAYSLSAESLVTPETELSPLPDGWELVESAFTKYSSGWVALAYQRSPISNIDYSYNRLVLLHKEDGQITSTLIDSGRTHPFWRDSLSRSSSDLELLRRLDGGFYMKRRHMYSEQDSTGEWVARYATDVEEFVHTDSTIYSRSFDCYGTLLSGQADTVITWANGWPYNGEITACINTRSNGVELPIWTDCIIRPYDLMSTPEYGLLLLTGYSPIIQLKRLNYDGTCQLISEVNVVMEDVVSHPAYGYAMITHVDNRVLLAQMSPDGEIFRQPTEIIETGSQLFDVTIADNGDIYFLWQSYRDFEYFSRLLIVPWYAVLDAPEVESPVIPSNLTLSSYPNPFNSTLTIKYDLPQAGHAKLTAYDLQGRVVANIFDSFTPAGSAELHWSPKNLASGVYFLNLEAPLAHTTHKILYLK